MSATTATTFVADKDSAVVVLQTSKAEIIGNGVDEMTLTATVKDPPESSGGGNNGELHHATGRCGNFTSKNNGIAITSQWRSACHPQRQKAGTHTVTVTLSK
ncbi:hypothetical protein MJ581_11375 [Escherichia coli]|nr:hypothetical protein MJ581_11375 [Escherichia coli]